MYVNKLIFNNKLLFNINSSPDKKKKDRRVNSFLQNSLPGNAVKLTAGKRKKKTVETSQCFEWFPALSPEELRTKPVGKCRYVCLFIRILEICMHIYIVL